jgi:hypothetical protein
MCPGALARIATPASSFFPSYPVKGCISECILLPTRRLTGFLSCALECLGLDDHPHFTTSVPRVRVLLSGRGDSPPLPNLAIDFFRSPLSPLPSHSDAPASLAQPFSPSLAQAGSLSRGIYHLPHPSSVAHDSRPKTPRLAFIPVHLTCAV